MEAGVITKKGPQISVKKKDQINQYISPSPSAVMISSTLTVFLCNVRQHRQCLHRFAQSHFVCQYPVNSLIIEIHEPVHSFQLVGFECALENIGLLPILTPALGTARQAKVRRFLGDFVVVASSPDLVCLQSLKQNVNFG